MKGWMGLMRSILEEFAYANISPEVCRPDHDSRYEQAMGAASRNKERLFNNMNESEKEVLQKYIEAQDEVNQLRNVKNLIHGYKWGLLMTAEAFLTGDDLYGGEDW